jgi:hypothetical protein
LRTPRRGSSTDPEIVSKKVSFKGSLPADIQEAVKKFVTIQVKILLIQGPEIQTKI